MPSSVRELSWDSNGLALTLIYRNVSTGSSCGRIYSIQRGQKIH